MGTKERREREREELKGKILDAAREMFASEGYEAVTMRRIAERIEYSPTAIYFHFKDKEALVRELCVGDFAILAEKFQKFARIEDPVERIRRIGLAYMQFGLENPNHYKFMFMSERPPVPPDEVDVKGDPERDSYAFLVLTIGQAIEAGRIRDEYADADLVAQLFWAAVHGVISLQVTTSIGPWIEWKPFRKRAEAMIDILLSAVSRPSRRK